MTAPTPRAERRAKAAEKLLADVEAKGTVSGRYAGFSTVTLTKDGYCRSTILFYGTAHSITTRGATPREALTHAFVFHKMAVAGFNPDGRY